jgi:predicted nucleic acid-binding protein
MPERLGFICNSMPDPEDLRSVGAIASCWAGCLTTTLEAPNLVHDAHLAATAIEHGLILCSTDGDFARFPGLRWQNPLAA